MNVLTNEDVYRLAGDVANHLRKDFNSDFIKIFPIPRGGVPAAYAISDHYNFCEVISNPDEADIFVDDLIDSGRTLRKWSEEYPGKKLYALLDKRIDPRYKDKWIVFPWEKDAESSIEDNIVRLLEFIGEDPSREGLLETPKRVAKAWQEWCSGYKLRPEDVLKTFEDGANGVDEMVIQKDIPFYSFCEHHLCPFFGTITIAYIPNGKIVGLSKLARLAGVFSRRLQVQERLTYQIADALEKTLKPKGVGVVVKARHMCIESRGVAKQGQVTLTSALRGVIKDKPEARAEFMELSK